MNVRHLPWIALVAAVLAACGGGGTGADAGTDSGAADGSSTDGGIDGSADAADGGRDAGPAAPTSCGEVDRAQEADAPPTDEPEITLSGVYRIDDFVTYSSEETVTIEPGTVFLMGPDAHIKFGFSDDPATVFAGGTEEEPILLCGTQERAGHWDNLRVLSGTTVDSSLHHVRIEDAGSDDGASLFVESAIELQNVTVSNGGGPGMRLHALAEGSSDFTVTGNGAEPAILQGAGPITNLPDGTYTGNGEDVILVSGYSMADETVFHDWGVPYRQTEEQITLGTHGGPLDTVTFEAGVEYQFCQDCRLLIGFADDPSAMYANGTEESPVVFTSHRDPAEPGDWNGISWLNGTRSDSVLEHAELRYGGKSDDANLYIDGGEGTIRNSTFASSDGWGIYVDREQAGLTIEDNNTFEDNAAGTVRYP